MSRLAQIVTKCIDFFYHPFRKWMSLQLFHYAACGGGNLVLDWFLYFITYNFVVGHENLIFQITLFNTRFTQVITPHIAALCIVFPITLVTGFWLQKNVTFTHSDVSKGMQLWRYIVIVMLNLAVNYYGLKLCVDILGWFPTPSKVLITLFTVAVSYVGQKYYTFKINAHNK
jgi:putative flippase GtrA